MAGQIPRHDPDGAASYIADITRDLAALARSNGLDTLGYLLDMARLEAENITGAKRAPEGD